MKENLWLIIAAILLSIGVDQVPCDARSNIALKTSGIRQTVSYQEHQNEKSLAKRLLPQWRDYAHQWITVSKGKSPALLWHRFSLTPQPVFFHWPMGYEAPSRS